MKKEVKTIANTQGVEVSTQVGYSNSEHSYTEKCSIIDDFFKKNNLVYLRGDEPSKWFTYDFSEKTFRMDNESYYIQIQMDGWFNLESKPGCGIGEYDIKFMNELIKLKSDLVEVLNEIN